MRVTAYDVDQWRSVDLGMHGGKVDALERGVEIAGAGSAAVTGWRSSVTWRTATWAWAAFGERLGHDGDEIQLADSKCYQDRHDRIRHSRDKQRFGGDEATCRWVMLVV